MWYNYGNEKALGWTRAITQITRWRCYMNQPKFTPESRICKQCGIEKSMSEFRPNSNGRGIGGRRARCRDCEREYHVQYNNSKAGKMRDERYCERNPEKRKAKDIVNKAVRAGKLPPVHINRCAHCGDSAQHYHHPDYSKPLHVVALCESCHRAVHATATPTTIPVIP